MLAKGSKWTPEQDEILIELNRKGMSCREIAEQMNTMFDRTFTREAVLGRKHRLGPEKCPKMVKPDRQVLQGKINAQKATSKPSNATGRTIPIRAQESKIPPLIGPSCITDLVSGECRWPYGKKAPFGWCGRQTAGGAFCQAHAKEATGSGSSGERGAERSALIAAQKERA